MVPFDFRVFYVFLSGLLIGSFLNVCICRIPCGRSVLFPSSCCTSCSRRITPLDLIPVVSFVLLRGRCRNCGEKISRRYIYVELLTGLLFSVIYIYLGCESTFLKNIFLTSFMIIAAFIDLEHYIVPNKLILFGLGAGAVFLYIIKDPLYESAWWGAASGGGFLLLLMILSRGGLGSGDVKLAAVVGIFLGWPLALFTVFLSCCLAGLTGISLILMKKMRPKDIIPFVPFMAISSYIAMIWGRELISWYIVFLKR